MSLFESHPSIAKPGITHPQLTKPLQIDSPAGFVPHGRLTWFSSHVASTWHQSYMGPTCQWSKTTKINFRPTCLLYPLFLTLKWMAAVVNEMELHQLSGCGSHAARARLQGLSTQKKLP